jgi:hypothetical protein
VEGVYVDFFLEGLVGCNTEMRIVEGGRVGVSADHTGI